MSNFDFINLCIIYINLLKVFVGHHISFHIVYSKYYLNMK